MQDLGAQNGTNGSKDHCDSSCEKSSVENIVLHLPNLPCTKIFRHGNPESGTASHAKSQDKKLDTAAGTNAGKSLGSKDLSYNGSVNNVIGLLEQISH